jgi:hypothetical protein
MITETAPRSRPGYRFYLVRLAWILLALFSTILVGMGAHFRYQQLIQGGTNSVLVEVDIPITIAAGLTVTAETLASFVSVLLGLLVFIRLAFLPVPYDRMAMFTSFMLVAFGVLINSTIDSIPLTLEFWQGVYTLIGIIGLLLFLGFLLVFPDGKIRPRWFIFFPVLLLFWMVSWFFIPALNPDSWSTLALSFLGGGLFLIGAAIQVYRFIRVSTPLQRQQTRWVAYSLVFLIVTGSLGLIAESQLAVTEAVSSEVKLMQLFAWLVSELVVIAFPAGLAVAMMRYRLWELDSLINRALVYSLLTGVLLLVYFVSVVLLQEMFRLLTDQKGPPAVVLSTLMIAALFNPLRRNLQTTIDRRFYRNRYDAARILEQYNAGLREEVALEQLLDQLTWVVDETMHPVNISIWLKD